MIPLIQARRQFIPAAETVFAVDQIVANTTSGAWTTRTHTDISIGSTGDTRQYWLGVIATGGSGAGGPIISATLGGNAFTVKRAHQYSAPTGYTSRGTFLNLSGYTSETTATLVVTADRTAYGGFVLLRTSKDTALENDFDTLSTNSGGTYPFSTIIPQEGICFGVASGIVTNGPSTLSGLDNMIFTSNLLGSSRGFMNLGWHASQPGETLATSFTTASQTSDAHMALIAAFGPNP